MIKEDFVKETTAKMLKSAGFEGECIKQNRPTLQTAAKWLRYERGISVEPISTRANGVPRCYRVFVNSNTTIENADFDTYEEALEFGIVKALKELKKMKSA